MRLKFSDYLIGLIGLVVTAMSFVNHKCEHVFTSVVQPAIKIEQPSNLLFGQSYQEYSWPTGVQEGHELICVKCFHRQKQVIEYDENQGRFQWPDSTECGEKLIDTCDSPYFIDRSHPCNYFDMKYQFVDTVKIGHVIRDKKSKIINAY